MNWKQYNKKDLAVRVVLLVLVFGVWLLLPGPNDFEHWLAKSNFAFYVSSSARMFLIGPMRVFVLVFLVLGLGWPASRVKKVPGWHTRNSLLLGVTLLLGIPFLAVSISTSFMIYPTAKLLTLFVEESKTFLGYSGRSDTLYGRVVAGGGARAFAATMICCRKKHGRQKILDVKGGKHRKILDVQNAGRQRILDAQERWRPGCMGGQNGEVKSAGPGADAPGPVFLPGTREAWGGFCPTHKWRAEGAGLLTSCAF